MYYIDDARLSVGVVKDSGLLCSLGSGSGCPMDARCSRVDVGFEAQNSVANARWAEDK